MGDCPQICPGPGLRSLNSDQEVNGRAASTRIIVTMRGRHQLQTTRGLVLLLPPGALASVFLDAARSEHVRSEYNEASLQTPSNGDLHRAQGVQSRRAQQIGVSKGTFVTIVPRFDTVNNQVSIQSRYLLYSTNVETLRRL